MGDVQAVQITQDLTQLQLPVQNMAWQDLVGVCPIHGTLRDCNELCPVLVRPPVSQVAVGVVLAALIVESMADLGPVMKPIPPMLAASLHDASKNGGLQYRRHQDEFVGRRLVEGIRLGG